MGCYRIHRLGWAAVLVLAGCAGSGQRVFNPKYIDPGLQGHRVRVYPITGVEIGNPSDFDRDFGGEGREFPSTAVDREVARLLHRALAERLQGVTLAPDTAWDSTLPAMRDTVLPLPKDPAGETAAFRYPADSGCGEKGVEPDLALSLEDMRFQRDVLAVPSRFDPSGATGVPGPRPRSRLLREGARRTLELTGKYLLWDCRAREVVAYGRVSGFSELRLAMGKRDWENAASQAARIIARDLSLEK